MADKKFILHGARVKKDLPAGQSLAQYVFTRLEHHGDRAALVQRVAGVEISLSYADVLRRAKSVAKLLRDHGLRHGDTVMLCCGNTVEFPPVMFGTLFAGGAIAPVNPDYETSDLLHLIGVMQPRVIVCDTTAEPCIREALTMHPSPVALLPMATVTHRLLNPHAADIEDFHLAKIDDPDNTVAILLCSSGTTGKHKGVEMVHSRMVLLASEMIRYLPSYLPGYSQQSSLNLSGPFWASCLLITLYSLNKGMRLVLLQNFTAGAYLNHIQDYKINIGIVGPQALIGLAKHESRVDYDLSSLHCVLYTGSAMSASMLAQAKNTLKAHVAVLYGMTECFGHLEPAVDVFDRPCNVGTLNDNVAAKVIDVFGNGKTLGPNVEGELCFLSPAAFTAYRGNPEATRKTFDEDGFLHSGDIGYYDEAGYFYIVDRIKDLIKYKGNHVSPTDIEEVLLNHPAVQEAAVVGVAHDHDWEHATGIVVVKHGRSVTEEELVTLVQEKLTTLQWLHGGVKFATSLPRTATGKLQKQVLRATYGFRPAV